jgi:hypothetical protein
VPVRGARGPGRAAHPRPMEAARGRRGCADAGAGRVVADVPGRTPSA